MTSATGMLCSVSTSSSFFSGSRTLLGGCFRLLCGTSFEEYKVLNEEILEEGTTSFLTNLYNKENGYKVNIEYTLISTDSISTTYSGDLEGTYILTRLY